MKRVLFAVLVLGLAVTGFAGQAMALPATLTPGMTATAVSDSIPASTYITSITSPFYHSVSGVTVSGSVYQEVRKADSDGMLIFVYVVNNDSISTEAFIRMTTINFGGWATDVAYESSSIAPSYFTRSSGLGSTIGFDFPSVSGLPKGNSSSKMWIKTNAESFGDGQSSVIDGGAENVFTYGPRVPEPASAMLLGFSLLGFAGMVIRRKFMA